MLVNYCKINTLYVFMIAVGLSACNTEVKNHHLLLNAYSTPSHLLIIDYLGKR